MSKLLIFLLIATPALSAELIHVGGCQYVTNGESIVHHGSCSRCVSERKAVATKQAEIIAKSIESVERLLRNKR